MKSRKPRIPVISPHFDGPAEIAGLDFQNGELTFYDSNGKKIIPRHVEVGTGYARESGKFKTVNQVQADGSKIDLDTNAALNKFEWLFAIDTNVHKFQDSTIGASVSVMAYVQIGEPEHTNDGALQDWALRVIPQDAYIFRNPKVNPELVGWRELMNRICDSSAYSSGEKVGIIVDSELSKIGAFNQRTEPVLGEHYLPEAFEILYASADVGADYVHNKLLRICDRTSSRILEYVAENAEILQNMEAIESPFIDGFTTVPSTIVLQYSRATS